MIKKKRKRNGWQGREKNKAYGVGKRKEMHTGRIRV